MVTTGPTPHRGFPLGKRAFLLACVLACLLAPAQAQASLRTFFGEDPGLGEETPLTSYPSSLAAQRAFLEGIKDAEIEVETLESPPLQTFAPLPITFNGGVTATLEGAGFIASTALIPGVGRYAISGDQWWDSSAAFSIRFSEPVAAFGFFGIDLGDFGSQLGLTLIDEQGTARSVVVPHAIDDPGGSVIYFGVIDRDAPFVEIVFYEALDEGDVFGFDDFTVATIAQLKPDFYAALGDSFSSGEGLGRNTGVGYFPNSNSAFNQCHRSIDAYPSLLRFFEDVARGNFSTIRQRAEAEESVFWEFLACSGASTVNVRAAGECQPDAGPCYAAPDDKPQLAQLSDLTATIGNSPNVVTLTIGGNDLGFKNVLLACLFFEDCVNTSAFPGGLDQWVRNSIEGRVRSNLRATYQEVKQAADPDSAVFVLGYPHLVSARFEVCGGVQLPIRVDAPPFFEIEHTLELSVAEQMFLRNTGKLLNDAIREEAARVGVHYVDVAGRFIGHELCGSADDWLFGITLPDLALSSWRNLSRQARGFFHPNRDGHASMIDVLLSYSNALQSGWSPGLLPNGFPKNPPPSGSVTGTAAPAALSGPPPSIGELSVTAAGTPICSTFAVFVPEQQIRIQGDGFNAGDTVSLVLRASEGVGSFEVTLNPVIADTAGVIDTTVELPASTPTNQPILVEADGSDPAGGNRKLLTLIGMSSSAEADYDGDGVPDACDYCPLTPGDTQVDSDGDYVGDGCDAAPLDFGNRAVLDVQDLDGDGVGDDSDSFTDLDPDRDGFSTFDDNCPLLWNGSQADHDQDGMGDACDPEFQQFVHYTIVPLVGYLAVRQASCGLLGIEAVLVLAACLALRMRRFRQEGSSR